MTRGPYSPTRRSHRPRLPALLIITASIGCLTFDGDPVATGSEPPIETASIASPATISLPPAPPLSQRAAEQIESSLQNPDTADTAASDKPSDPEVLTGRWAMLFSVALLERGCEKFEQISDYTATFYKQERINGELLEGQSINMKLRHRPFSVYMKWLDGDKGRQLIYVEGQNDGNMLVQLGGVKGRLLGTLTIPPNAPQAMAESRYPITGAGLLNLARTVLEYRQRDLERGTGVQCEIHDNQTHNGRPCYVFVTTYESPEASEKYRKSILYIDKELSMPVCVRNYTWSVDGTEGNIDDHTLIEHYAYSDIRIEQNLADADFDRSNEAYRMRR